MRYKVDLKAFMAACEANYFGLRKLMPGLDGADRFSLRLPGRGAHRFHLDVLERTAYTMLVEISQSGGEGAGGWLRMPRLRVRMYHDARLAEVVAFEGAQMVRPRNPYPNRAMHQPDEKAQWNRFLADWLGIAIRHGYSADAPCEFGAL